MISVIADVQSNSGLSFTGTVLAALLGGFFGSVVKEWVTDRYTKKRRLREIRVAINLSVSNLFRTVRLYVASYNVIAMYRAQMNIIESDDDEDSIADKKIYYGKLCGDMLPTMTEQYNKMSEFESQLVASSYESESYIENVKYKKLLKYISKITDLTVRQNYSVSTYVGMNAKQIQTFWETQMDNAIQAKIREMDAEYHEVSVEINRLLK